MKEDHEMLPRILRFRIGKQTVTIVRPGRIAVILVAVLLFSLVFRRIWHHDDAPPRPSGEPLSSHAEIPSMVDVIDANPTVEDRSIDRLTPAETIGAVFYRTHDTSTWHLLSRANPQAVDAVEVIVASDELPEYHANAWRALGYLGDGRHVRLMQRTLQTKFSGLLDENHRKELHAMFDFLGLSCRRDVPEAIVLVDQMQSRKYWPMSKFHLYPDVMRKRRDGESIELQGYVMWGYALSRRTDFSEPRWTA
jgi:hypothetical protein